MVGGVSNQEGEAAAESAQGRSTEDVVSQRDIVDGEARGVEDGDLRAGASAAAAADQHLAQRCVDRLGVILAPVNRDIQFTAMDRASV